MSKYTLEQITTWKENRKLKAVEVLKRLPKEALNNSSVVGRWVWLYFEEKPIQAILDEIKALGFKWNRDRGVWQHPCGEWSGSSPADPRLKYIEVKGEDLLSGSQSSTDDL